MINSSRINLWEIQQETTTAWGFSSYCNFTSAALSKPRFQRIWISCQPSRVNANKEMVDYCIEIFFYYPNQSKRNTKKKKELSTLKFPTNFCVLGKFEALKMSISFLIVLAELTASVTREIFIVWWSAFFFSSSVCPKMTQPRCFYYIKILLHVILNFLQTETFGRGSAFNPVGIGWLNWK